MGERVMDLQIGLQKIEFLTPRINTGIKIVMVIYGELTIETNSRYYQMQEKDLLVINRNQLYQARANKDNCILVLTISDDFIDQVYSAYRNIRFECFSKEVYMGREPMISSIRKLLAELVIALYRRDETYRIELQEYVCKILVILIRRFKQEGSAFEKMDAEDQRLTQIVNYIEENYGQLITLEDVANKFYLSAGYLSRYFKRKMGMGFSRFIMNVRLKHSLKDLLYTSLSISQIAMNNGFPNAKSFTSLFKEVYGETPHVFRESHKEKQNDAVKNYAMQDAAVPISSPEVLTQLGMLLMDDDTSYSNTDTHFEKLALTIQNQTKEKINCPDYILVIGNLKNLLREDVRAQFLIAKEELQFKYIGVMHLINETLIPPKVETDERIATTSPYFNLATVLNFAKKEGTALFVWIECLEILYDEEKYFYKLQEFMKYCLQLYGEAYLSTWHFMFYEPFNTQLSGEELRRIYLKLHALLKKQVAGIKVGAFLHYSFVHGKALDNHAWLLAETEKIDFVGYDANQNEVINFNEIENDSFFLTKDYIKEKTEKVKAYLKKNRFEKPLHLVNWNTLSGNTRYTNGVFFRGALVLKNVLDLASEVATLGFWINTELHEEERKDLRIQLDGLELFHYFNGKRPVYFVLQLFSRLRGPVIQRGPDYIMTCNERGYQVVLMNRNYIHPFLSVKETFLRKLNKDIHVTLSGLPVGEYQIRKLVLDKDHGALYTKWCDLNTKYGMDAEITDYIIRTTYPLLEVFDETSNGEWSFYSYLTTNAIHFFDIRRIIG